MSAPAAPFTLRGWHVAAAVCGFFGVVIAVDMGFAVLAVRSFPGQVSVTPYEDGLLYNKRLAQEAAQARLGWTAAAWSEPGRVMLAFRAADGTPVRGLALTAGLARPATEAGALHPTFRETAPGRYEAGGAFAGAWDLTATAADKQGRSFVLERRLTWR